LFGRGAGGGCAGSSVLVPFLGGGGAGGGRADYSFLVFFVEELKKELLISLFYDCCYAEELEEEGEAGDRQTWPEGVIT